MKNDIEYRNKITILSFVLAIAIVLRHSVNIDIYNLDQYKHIWGFGGGGVLFRKICVGIN